MMDEKAEKVLLAVDRFCSEQLVGEEHEYVMVLITREQIWQVGSNQGRQYLDANKDVMHRFFDHCYKAETTGVLECNEQTQESSHVEEESANPSEMTSVTGKTSQPLQTTSVTGKTLQTTSVAECSTQTPETTADADTTQPPETTSVAECTTQTPAMTGGTGDTTQTPAMTGGTGGTTRLPETTSVAECTTQTPAITDGTGDVARLPETTSVAKCTIQTPAMIDGTGDMTRLPETTGVASQLTEKSIETGDDVQRVDGDSAADRQETKLETMEAVGLTGKYKRSDKNKNCPGTDDSTGTAKSNVIVTRKRSAEKSKLEKESDAGKRKSRPKVDVPTSPLNKQRAVTKPHNKVQEARGETKKGDIPQSVTGMITRKRSLAMTADEQNNDVVSKKPKKTTDKKTIRQDRPVTKNKSKMIQTQTETRAGSTKKSDKQPKSVSKLQHSADSAQKTSKQSKVVKTESENNVSSVVGSDATAGEESSSEAGQDYENSDIDEGEMKEGSRPWNKDVLVYTCKTCNKSFDIENKMKRHLMIHVTDRDYVCSNCGAGFLYHRGLQEHSVVCKKNPHRLKLGKDVDHLQKKSTVRLEGTRVLIVPSTTEKGIFTDITDEDWAKREPDAKKRMELWSKYKKIFKKKIDDHYNRNKDLVSVSKKTITKKSVKANYLKSRMYHKMSKTVDTKICITPEIREWYQKFYLDNVNNKIDNTEKDSTDSEDATCKICDQVYQSVWKLRNHMVIHTGVKSFKCSFCNKKFYYLESLNQHVVSCKKNPKKLINPTGKELHAAIQKLVILPSPKEHKLYTNIQKASDEGDAEQQSDVKTDNLNNVTSKLLTEACEEGLRILKNPGNDKKYPFKCKFCGSCFSSFPQLRLHIPVHTEIKRFVCYFCPETFLVYEELRDHVMLHFQHTSKSQHMDSETSKTSNNSDQQAYSNMAGATQECEKVKIEVSAETSEPSNSITANWDDMPSLQGNADMKHSDSLEDQNTGRNENSEKVVMESGQGDSADSGQGVLVISDQCQDCGQVFDNVRELRKHRLNHNTDSKGNSFMCKDCGKTFKQEKYVSAHRFVCQGKAKLGADKSSKQGNSKDAASFSLSRNGESKNRSITTTNVPTPADMKKRKNSSKSSKQKEKESSTDDSLKCSKCPSEFTDIKSLVWHELSCHGRDAVTTCPVCKTDIKEGMLSEHIHIDNNIDENAWPLVYPYTGRRGAMFECNRCLYTFTNLEDLWVHQAEHAKEVRLGVIRKKVCDPYPCKICDKMFASIHSYRRHFQSIHIGERNFICEVCGKKFKTKDGCRTHMVTHTEEGCPYSCEYCGKKFLKPSILKKHMPVHTRYSAFMCEDCGKTFVQRQNLLKHRLLKHSDVRKFKCDICGKAYKVQDKLKNHMKAHVIKDGIQNTYGKLYPCEVCGKLCVDSGRLKAHMISHSDERPFSCHHCGRRFKQKSKLDRHLKRFPEPHTMHDTQRQSTYVHPTAHKKFNYVNKFQVKMEPQFEYEASVSSEYAEVTTVSTSANKNDGSEEAEEVMQQVAILEADVSDPNSEMVQIHQADNFIVIPREYLEENSELLQVVTDAEGNEMQQILNIVVVDKPPSS